MSAYGDHCADRTSWVEEAAGVAARNSPFVGFAEIDQSGRLLNVSELLCAMLFYDPPQLQGRDLKGITHPSDLPADSKALELLAAGEIGRYRAQKRLIRSDGSTFWADVQVEPAGGMRSGAYQMTVLDITDRKHLEEALQRRNARLVQFASLLGHDLRTVLNVMALHAQLAKASLREDSPRVLSSLDTIVTTARDAASFMTQLQEYAASVTHHADLDRVPLQHVVAQTLAVLEPQAEGLRIEVGELPRVLSKEAILARVLLGIFQSSIARCAGADPRIEIAAVCSATRPGNVGLVVRDNGAGIDPRDQEQMFSALFRSEGTSAHAGLGMVFCREHIEDIGGSIWVESAPGHGTQVAILLPGG
jgi:PAS domain S-box-containing protein